MIDAIVGVIIISIIAIVGGATVAYLIKKYCKGGSEAHQQTDAHL